MLAKNGASLNYTALLTILVLIGLAIQLDVGVLGVIPRLCADIGVIQRIDLIGAVVRLTILVLLAFIFLNAGIISGARSPPTMPASLNRMTLPAPRD